MTASTVRRPTVFLIAQPTISRKKAPVDLAPLYEHGDVQVVLPMSDSPTFTPVKCYEVMEDRLTSSIPNGTILCGQGVTRCLLSWQA
jgi:hypothetical protein